MYFGHRNRYKMTRIFYANKACTYIFSRGGHKVKPSDPVAVIQLSITWDFAVVAHQKHRTAIQKSAPFVPDSTNIPFSTSADTGQLNDLQKNEKIENISKI